MSGRVYRAVAGRELDTLPKVGRSAQDAGHLPHIHERLWKRMSRACQNRPEAPITAAPAASTVSRHDLPMTSAYRIPSSVPEMICSALQSSSIFWLKKPWILTVRSFSDEYRLRRKGPNGSD